MQFSTQRGHSTQGPDRVHGGQGLGGRDGGRRPGVWSEGEGRVAAGGTHAVLGGQHQLIGAHRTPPPVDSLTIHGNSPSAARVPPTTRGLGSPWAAVVRALAELAGTMTRAAVIAPKRGVLRAVVASRGGLRRIGFSSSPHDGVATICTPSSTAGDGTGVRGHRYAGIETQPKRRSLTEKQSHARIGTAARRRSGGPSPGCWTSILAHNCAEVVARW